MRLDNLKQSTAKNIHTAHLFAVDDNAVEGINHSLVLVPEGILEVGNVGEELLGGLGGDGAGSSGNVGEELRGLGLDFGKGLLSDGGELLDDLGDLGGDLTGNVGDLVPEVSEEVSEESLGVAQSELGNDQVGDVLGQNLVDGLDGEFREVDLGDELLGNLDGLLKGILGSLDCVLDGSLSGIDQRTNVNTVSGDGSVDSVQKALDDGLELLRGLSTDLLEGLKGLLELLLDGGGDLLALLVGSLGVLDGRLDLEEHLLLHLTGDLLGGLHDLLGLGEESLDGVLQLVDDALDGGGDVRKESLVASGSQAHVEDGLLQSGLGVLDQVSREGSAGDGHAGEEDDCGELHVG